MDICPGFERPTMRKRAGDRRGNLGWHSKETHRLSLLEILADKRDPIPQSQGLDALTMIMILSGARIRNVLREEQPWRIGVVHHQQSLRLGRPALSPPV
jgi:hypothetical protein